MPDLVVTEDAGTAPEDDAVLAESVGLLDPEVAWRSYTSRGLVVRSTATPGPSRGSDREAAGRPG